MKYIKLVLCFIVFLLPINIFAVSLIDTYSNVIVIYDMTDNKILFDKNGSGVKSIASLTKMMTAITAIEMIEKNPSIDLTSQVKVTNKMLNNVSSVASVAGLETGDVVTYEDLLYAMILPSGADASIVLAMSLSDNINSFVDEMNVLANKIGVENTHFVNTHGLDQENHYGTGDDVLKILIYSMKNETFKKVFTAKEYVLSNNLKVYSTIYKYNKLLNLDTSRILGSKTGYTGDAGTCMATYFTSNGHEFLSITLGAKHSNEDSFHLRDSLNLIDFMDDNFNNQVLINGEKITSIDVHWSNVSSVDIVSKEVKKYLPNDYDKSLFKYEYVGKEDIYPSFDKDEPIGKINYYYDNELFDSEDVFVKDSIKFSFWTFFKAKILYFIIAFIILFLIFNNIKKKKRKRKRKMYR